MPRLPRLQGLAEDLRSSLRLIRRSPGFTALAVIALGLGIGANTAIFSVIDAVLLRPLPYDHPERLAVVLHHGTDPVSAANLLDWRREATSFSGLAAAEIWAVNLTGAEPPERVSGLRVTADLFGLLGVRPALGRLFRPDEDQPGREHEVILAHDLWVRRFGAASDVVGRTVHLDGVPYTVVGVMASDFRFPPFWATGTELWAPLPLAPRATDRDGNSLRAFARLAPGVSLDRAQAEITAITRRLEDAYPGTNRDVRVVGLTDRVVSGVRSALWVLAAAVGFVLLIACANVAHLLLARASARRQELAIRSALGASRGRLVRQLLTESALLAGLGGAVGLVLAAGAVRLLKGLGPATIPRLAGVSLDQQVLAFTLGLSLVTGLGFGLLPALATADVRVADALKSGGSRGGTGDARHHRAQDLLVASEFALAVVLLIGAGLAIRTFVALRAIDPGFDPRGVTGMIVSVAGAEAGRPGRRADFYRDLVDRLSRAPGVDAVGGINHLPIVGDVWGFRYRIEGRPEPARGEEPTAVFRAVLPGYFATVRLPLIAGRDVTWDRSSRRARRGHRQPGPGPPRMAGPGPDRPAPGPRRRDRRLAHRGGREPRRRPRRLVGPGPARRLRSPAPDRLLPDRHRPRLLVRFAGRSLVSPGRGHRRDRPRGAGLDRSGRGRLQHPKPRRSDGRGQRRARFLSRAPGELRAEWR